MSTQPHETTQQDTRPLPPAGRTPVAPPEPSGPSMATVVWGLVLLSLAALAGLTELTGWDVDPTLALPAVLLGAGALLVVTAVVAVVRRPRREPRPGDETDLPG